MGDDDEACPKPDCDGTLMWLHGAIAILTADGLKPDPEGTFALCKVCRTSFEPAELSMESIDD